MAKIHQPSAPFPLLLRQRPLYNNHSMKGDDKKAADQAGQTDWQYKPGDNTAETADAPNAPAGSDGSVEWTASEFVAHDKGFGWYAALAVLAILVASLVYLITREVLSTIVIIIMAAILGVAGSHKPRVVEYRLDASGLTAGKKFYPYHDYKSFVVPDQGPFVSVMLIPLKRISLPVGAFLAPDSQQRALNLLSEHVPMQQRDPGFFDTLMRQLRF